jgi:hypothetical protein
MDILGKSAGVLSGQAPRRHVVVVELKFQAVMGRTEEYTAKGNVKERLMSPIRKNT